MARMIRLEQRSAKNVNAIGRCVQGDRVKKFVTKG